jgi:uncharacterized membrane protein
VQLERETRGGFSNVIDLTISRITRSKRFYSKSIIIIITSPMFYVVVCLFVCVCVFLGQQYLSQITDANTLGLNCFLKDAVLLSRNVCLFMLPLLRSH